MQYLGFRGTGKQVRDLIHVDDIGELIDEQLADPNRWSGGTFNVGGGSACSLSLLELTELCREITGRVVEVSGAPEAVRPGDVPLYVSDCSRLLAQTDWRPLRGPRDILAGVYEWAQANEQGVRSALEFG